MNDSGLADIGKPRNLKPGSKWWKVPTKSKAGCYEEVWEVNYWQVRKTHRTSHSLADLCDMNMVWECKSKAAHSENEA